MLVEMGLSVFAGLTATYDEMIKPPSAVLRAGIHLV